MMKKLLTLMRPILLFFKYSMIGLLLQCLLFNLLMARETNAQNIYDVAIELSVQQRPLKEVLTVIESKTDYTFTFSSRKINVQKLITLSGRERTLGEALDVIAKQANLEVQQQDKIISLKPKREAGFVSSTAIGVIKGRVIDDILKSGLPGASIIQQGTTNGTTTDLNGEFFLRTPAGEITLEISYIGYKKIIQIVSVNEGATTELEITMLGEVTELSGVIVKGSLQGQQKALNQQKNADNIKNIVSADQIGRFPDPNVAEALQRIPAVNIERDQGEGRYVLVRGLAPQFTNISINGEQIPSPEADVRYVALDAIPADQLASIEVSKSITPDMDGDAIGGSVNLITRTAQTEEVRISSSAVVGYNDISGKANPQGSLEVGKRFLQNKLGIMLNASYYETERGSDNWERDGGELDLRDYNLARTRLGLSSTIDYKFNEKSEVYFRTIYNKFTDREFRNSNVFVPNEDNSPFQENALERYSKDRLEKQIVTSYNLGARHNFTGFNLDYELSYAEAIQDTPFDHEIASVFEADQLSIDFDTDKEFPSFSVNDLPHTNPNNDYLDNTLYEFDEVTMGNTYAKDINKTAKINLGIPYSAGEAKGLIKLGGKIRMKEKSYSITENVFSYTGTDDLTLDQYAFSSIGDNFLGGRYTLRPNADNEKFVKDFFNPDRQNFELDVEGKLITEAVEAYTATEDVYAGYIMTKLQWNKLMLLGGVRYENTKVKYNSSYVINESDIIPASGGTDYGFLLPQVHARYQINENTNLRAALTRSYARPNFSDIVPAQEININENEGTIGNPELKPVTATNIDILAERYFGSVGVLSGGLFFKKLDDFIFSRRFESSVYPGSEGVPIIINQSQNGESADLLGFEIAYQQNLSFLPGAFKGLSIYTNYTFTSSQARIQSREDSSGEEEIRLPGQAKHVGNFSLGYDLGRFNFRVSANFNGEYITELGEDASEDLYVKDRLQLDATATVAINPKFRFFAEFLNITNQPFEVYQGVEDRYVQREFYSWWTRVGLKFDF